MLFSLAKRICPIALALALMVACGGIAHAQEGSPAVTDTNAQITLPGQGMFQQIHDDLFGATKLGNSTGPGVGVRNKPSKYAAPGPRSGDAKNGGKDDPFFTDLNQLDSPPTIEEMLNLPEYGPDGRDKRKLSPMERYFETMENKAQAQGSNDLGNVLEMMWDAKNLSGTNALNPMLLLKPGGDDLMQGMMQMLKGAPGANDPASASAPAGDAPSLTPDHDTQRRFDEFKRLLDPSLPPPTSPGSAGAFNQLLYPAPTPVSVPANLPAVVAPFQNSYAPVVGTAMPAANGLRPYATEYTMPAAPTPASVRSALLQEQSEPKPVVMDPFKQNMPKRAF